MSQLDRTCVELMERLQQTPANSILLKIMILPAEVKKESRDRIRGVRYQQWPIRASTSHRLRNDILFQNCLSFRKYYKIRLAETFESSEEASNKNLPLAESTKGHLRIMVLTLMLFLMRLNLGATITKSIEPR